jgi:hypothetical protein
MSYEAPRRVKVEFAEQEKVGNLLRDRGPSERGTPAAPRAPGLGCFFVALVTHVSVAAS